MLRQQARLFNWLELFSDLFIIALAFVLAYISLSNIVQEQLHLFPGIILPAFLVWPWLLYRQGLYDSIRRLSYLSILRRLLEVHLYGGIALSAAVFIFEHQLFSRRFLLVFVLISLLLFALQRSTVLAVLHLLRRRGRNIRYLLIVGNGEKARKTIELIEEHQAWGLKIHGFIHVMPTPAPASIFGYPVLGQVSGLIDICKNTLVDEVIFCLPKPTELVIDVEHCLRELEELGITVRMVLGDYEVYTTRRELTLLGNQLPMLTFYTKEFDSLQLLTKRLIDIVGGLVGVLLTMFLFPFIALAILLDAPGPILFSQERVGENGRIFRCWKFRSMYRDAEARKQALMAQNQMNGAIFKIKDDPRVTRVGKFLRKTSLDEFPQFWNVLTGDMSLVGTRPPTPAEVQQYENWHRRRISIKPGITGLWQVSGRNQITDFDQIVRLDLQYIDNWSIWFDIRILLRTIRVVLLREGSC